MNIKVRKLQIALNYIAAFTVIVGMLTTDLTNFQGLVLMGIVFILMEVTQND